MMNKKIYYIFLAFGLVFLNACTDDFAELNTNPNQISSESLKQNKNHIGAYFPTMIQPLIGDQIEHNLTNDSFVRHLATPTPFVGGVNNTTYVPTWNNPYMNNMYSKVMAPARQVIQIAEADGETMFVQWAKLLQVTAMSRVSAIHGPIIYSNYGTTGDVAYDSEPELYNNFFSDLDVIVSTFSADTSYTQFKNFDAIYGGSIPHWIKYANSLRLQLAMRLVNVDPALAKTQAEKAINDPGGLIDENSENFNLYLYGGIYKEARICFSWNDTRMSATMESILGGYDDPRVSKYFAPVADASLVSDHPDFPYKGIRNGAQLLAKDTRIVMSTISEDFKNVTHRRFFDAAEVHFMLAEANLRGWSTPLSAQDHYKTGVNLSFEYWGVSGADAYLADNSKTPLDYDDTTVAGPINDFTSRITATVAWDEAGSNEEKLEKIMTQKWIAAYGNTIEAWVDHRRTGYPKLPYNYQNSSKADTGIIPADGFIKRMLFNQNERTNNPSGYAGAVQALGGEDLVSTRLYWDIEGPNF
jgi:hypothetical protein